MGYELHITRSETWLDAEANPLTESEWRALVADDESLTVSANDYYERKDLAGAIVRIPAVLWLDDSEVAFWFDRGEVTTKSPNDATIIKMLQLAARLNARLVGDDNEEYLSSPLTPGYAIRGAASEPDRAIKPAKPWWRLW